MNGTNQPILPIELDNLSASEQHILNRILGECVPVQEVSEEMALSEESLLKTVDRVWLELSITTRQQFIRFWKSMN
jgi:hypothetical protein